MSPRDPILPFAEPTAVFSPCRTWRYTLHRRVGPEPGTVAFIGLNPSTADETLDDPTIRRCKGFAARWGFGRFTMLNLYGIRSTDPRGVWVADDPVGPDNDRHIAEQAAAADLVIAAWGAFPLAANRARAVADLVGELRVLGLSKAGHPRHPLYMPYGVELTPWRPA